MHTPVHELQLEPRPQVLLLTAVVVDFIVVGGGGQVDLKWVWDLKRIKT